MSDALGFGVGYVPNRMQYACITRAILEIAPRVGVILLNVKPREVF